MTPQQEQIMVTVRSNGGSIDWTTLIDSVDHVDRQKALSNVRVLEGEGMLERVVAKNPDNGKPELSINLVGE